MLDGSVSTEIFYAPVLSRNLKLLRFTSKQTDMPDIGIKLIIGRYSLIAQLFNLVFN